MLILLYLSNFAIKYTKVNGENKCKHHKQIT